MSNEQLRKQLEEKYNINLDTETEIGEKTYWDLREYFTKDIEEDNLLIPVDCAHMCCHRTDIESIKDEFNKQMKEFIENDPGPCDDCSNIENNELQEPPPAYN